ncbi:MAG: putative oxidoreductase [Pseudomonadota bacterium]|nr:putative oxidoreductase [Pseudomonadota bacterium]
MMTSALHTPAPGAVIPPWARFIQPAIALFQRIPDSLIAFVGRFSIAAVFWKSGQTKIEGLAIDFIDGTYTLGLPKLADSAVALFQDEYALPLLPPALAAGDGGVCRTCFSDSDSVRSGDPLFSSGAIGDDAGHSASRLSRRLPNARRLGGSVALPGRQGTRYHLYRPLDRPALWCDELNAYPQPAGTGVLTDEPS